MLYQKNLMWFGKVGLLDFVILNFGLLEFYVNLEFSVEEILSNSITLANESLTWYRFLAYIIAQHFRTLASKNSVWAYKGFPGGSSGKEAACQCRLEVTDMGSIPGLGRSPGGGHGNPLQYSCLKNLMDKGAWHAEVHGIVQSQTGLQRFSMYAHMSI